MLRAFPDTHAFMRFCVFTTRPKPYTLRSIFFLSLRFSRRHYDTSFSNFEQQIRSELTTDTRHTGTRRALNSKALSKGWLEKRLNGVVTEKGLLSPWTRRGAGRQPIRPKNRTSVLVERYRPPSPPPPPAPSHPWKRHSNSDPFASESSSFSDSRSFETIHLIESSRSRIYYPLTYLLFSPSFHAFLSFSNLRFFIF